MPQAVIDRSGLQECINNCQECHAICVETSAHCLDLGGEHAARPHMVLLADCAQICAVSANYMLRGSPRHGRTCAVCAEVCRECAEECERMAGGDRLMARCAEVCRRCAESCDRMAAAARMR